MKRERIVNEEIVKWLIENLLKYCPIVNRISYIGNCESKPKISFLFRFYHDKTCITIMYGTDTYQTGVELSYIDEVLDITNIYELIDYLVNDGRIIHINDSDNTINICFPIYWSNDTIKGLAVGDIEVSLEFINCPGIKNYYLKLLKNRYSEEPRVDDSRRLVNLFINSATVEELIAFLKTLNLEDLKNILKEQNSGLFEKYFESTLEQPKLERKNPEIIG